MPREISPAPGNRRPWVTFIAEFAALYGVIAVVMLLGGTSAETAWGTSAAVLIGPALGMGIARYRKRQ
jgi:hypothetical protein